MTYQPYQQRVVDERAELDQKLEKLATFLESSASSNIAKDEKMRMVKQAIAMRLYSSILSERIEAFQ